AAGRVLGLLHPLLPSPGRRAPVHLAQGLPLRVLADGMEVEAAGPAEQQPLAVGRLRARVGEDAVEVDEPRVDEERTARAEIHLRALEAEGILEHRTREPVRVAAARDGLEVVVRVEAAAVRP